MLDLGDREVTILHVPGHSPGHIAVHDPLNRALIIGDASLGATVPTADNRPAFPPTYRDVDDYVASAELIRLLHPDLILTAHYPVYEGDATTAFLDETVKYTPARRPRARRRTARAHQPARRPSISSGHGARSSSPGVPPLSTTRSSR